MIIMSAYKVLTLLKLLVEHPIVTLPMLQQALLEQNTPGTHQDRDPLTWPTLLKYVRTLNALNCQIVKQQTNNHEIGFSLTAPLFNWQAPPQTLEALRWLQSNIKTHQQQTLFNQLIATLPRQQQQETLPLLKPSNANTITISPTFSFTLKTTFEQFEHWPLVLESLPTALRHTINQLTTWLTTANTNNQHPHTLTINNPTLPWVTITCNTAKMPKLLKQQANLTSGKNWLFGQLVNIVQLQEGIWVVLLTLENNKQSLCIPLQCLEQAHLLPYKEQPPNTQATITTIQFRIFERLINAYSLRFNETVLQEGTTPTGERYIDIEATNVSNPTLLLARLRRYAAQTEILHPESLRQQIKEEWRQKLASLYQ
jgi:hypothetical protein